MKILSNILLGVKRTYKAVSGETRELPAEVKEFITLTRKNYKPQPTVDLHLPQEFSVLTRIPSTRIGRFIKSLTVHKKSLMHELNLDERTYDMLSQVALSISREESSFGTASKFKIYNNLEKNSIITKLLSFARRVKEGDGTLSLGMTRLKIDKMTDAEKEILKKYGITYGGNISNITNPEQSAVATIVHLDKLLKEYPEYLRAAKTIKPDMSNSEVLAAIERAKTLIHNDTTRPLAIRALRAPKGTDAAKEALEQAGLTQNDLNDLRTYASTVELSPQAFLAAGWNGKMIIPEGPRKDLAYINLLHTICEKGYIANIMQTSKVFA